MWGWAKQVFNAGTIESTENPGAYISPKGVCGKPSYSSAPISGVEIPPPFIEPEGPGRLCPSMSVATCDNKSALDSATLVVPAAICKSFAAFTNATSSVILYLSITAPTLVL